jgi:hypothetical protein
MTTISTEDAVRSIVYVHDLAAMKVDAKLPLSMKDFEITQELLDTHIPTHEERAAMIAYQSCYFAFIAVHKNATYEDFRQNVNPEAIQTVTQSVVAKIPETVKLEDLKEIHRVQFLNLTRVAKERQISEE